MWIINIQPFRTSKVSHITCQIRNISLLHWHSRGVVLVCDDKNILTQHTVKSIYIWTSKNVNVLSAVCDRILERKWHHEYEAKNHAFYSRLQTLCMQWLMPKVWNPWDLHTLGHLLSWWCSARLQSILHFLVSVCSWRVFASAKWNAAQLDSGQGVDLCC